MYRAPLANEVIQRWSEPGVCYFFFVNLLDIGYLDIDFYFISE